MGAKDSKLIDNIDYGGRPLEAVRMLSISKPDKSFLNKKEKNAAKKNELLSTIKLSQIVQVGKIEDVKRKLSMLKNEVVSEISTMTNVSGLQTKIDVEDQRDMKKRLKSKVNEKDNDGNSALHYAARDHFPEILQELLNAGADPNLTNDKGSTPLHAASRNEPLLDTEKGKDVITYLLRDGSNVNAQDHNGATPMHLAIHTYHLATIRILLKTAKDINPQLTNGKGENILHVAAMYGAFDVFKLLSKRGLLNVSDIKAKDEDSHTPLHLCCKYKQLKSFKAIMERFKDKNVDMKELLVMKDKDGNTPFHLVAGSGCTDTLETFMEYYECETGTAEQSTQSEGTTLDADSEDSYDDTTYDSWNESSFEEDEQEGPPTIKQLCCQRNNEGETPLHLAAKAGEKSSVEMIIQKMKAEKIDMVDKNQRTALFDAVINGSLEVVQLLIDNGSDIKHSDKEGYSPILMAAECGKEPVLKILLMNVTDYKIRADSTKILDQNAFHLAAGRKDKEAIKIIKFLLKFSKDSGYFDECYNIHDYEDRNANRALHLAVKRGRTECIQALLDYNAVVDERNADANTPTHIACKQGELRALKILVKHDVTVLKTPDEDGNTPLHIAVAKGHEKVVEFLLTCKYTEKEARNNRKHTPLYMAAQHGYVNICKQLLKAGASIHPDIQRKAENKRSLGASNCLHVACKEGHTDLAILFLKENADINSKDEDGNNCLNIAILNRKKETARAIVKSEKWKEALNNRTRNEEYENTTPFRQLIEKMPDVAKTVLDRCVSFEKEFDSATGEPLSPSQNDEEIPINLDFQFIEDDLSKTEKQHPLKLMVNHRREDLLNHPLTKHLITQKWLITCWLYYFSMFFYAIYLTFLTGYMLHVSVPYSTNTTGGKMDIIYKYYNDCDALKNLEDKTILMGSDLGRSVFVKAGQYILFVLAILNLISETIQWWHQRRKYFKQYDNWLDVIVYVFAFFLTIDFTECQAETAMRLPWQWKLGVFCLFLSWVNTIFYSKVFPSFGIYINVFKAVGKGFFSVILVFSIFFVAFGLTFFVLPHDHQGEFKNVESSIVNSWVDLMAPRNADLRKNIHDFGLADVFILSFSVIMQILLWNVLIGMAVGDTKSHQKSAKLNIIGLRVGQILDVEYKSLIDFRKKLPNKFRPQSNKVFKNQEECRMFNSKDEDDDKDEYDKLKTIAMREVEETKTASHESKEKTMRKFKNQMEEMTIKFDAQGRQIGEIENMLKQLLKKADESKDKSKALKCSVRNNTGSDVKCVLDWEGMSKSCHHTISSVGTNNVWTKDLKDTPHKLTVIYEENTRLTYEFQPKNENNFIITTEDKNYLELVDDHNVELKKVNIVKTVDDEENERL